MAELLIGVYFIHCQLRIKNFPYDKKEDGKKVLSPIQKKTRGVCFFFESLLQNELSEKVIADRKEKFNNPAILLGLKNDGINI